MKIRYNGMRKWKGTQKAMEIKYVPYIKKFYAYQVEEVNPTPIETKESNICSIDLGIKRYMSVYIKNGLDINLTYESEHIFEEYVKLTEKIAYYQGLAKKDNGKYTTRRINRLFLKRRRKLQNYMNNIIAHLFRKLVYYKVSKVIIGDLKGIRDSKIPEHYRNKTKINQMIQNFWSFDIFKKKLENKCEEFGIELIAMDERGTSSTCPECGERVKPNDRRFKCKACGYRNDRDVVGSINILKNYYHAHHSFGIDDIGVENHPVVSTVLIES
jgi:putative transposase